MPSDQVSAKTSTAHAADAGRMSIASVRILRLALGTALSMLFCQIVNWPMSFITPVLTMFILALPMPVMNLGNGVKFILVFVVSIYAGLIFLPFMLNQRMVGILLLALALYHTFYYTARGGSPVIGAFATVGLALVTSIGTVSTDAVLQVSGGLSTGALFGVLFIWVGHAILPDSLARPEPPPARSAKTQPEKPDLADARRSAFRSLVVVMPVILWFLLSSASASYAAFLIKVASMGQQAGIDQSRQVARSLLESTVIGGVAAIIAWQVLSIWPSLVMYVLLIGLAGLVMGPRIFSGPGMHPAGATWSYGYLTMIVVLAPAVLDTQSGAAAGAAFWTRLEMFIWATIYGTGAVFVFDSLWPRRRAPESG
jgi:uncharacterized membrane protein YccC